jgi:hypothetical protein
MSRSLTEEVLAGGVDDCLADLRLGRERWAALVGWAADTYTSVVASDILPETGLLGKLAAVRRWLPPPAMVAMHAIESHHDALRTAEREAAFVLGVAHGRRTRAAAELAEAQTDVRRAVAAARASIEGVSVLDAFVSTSPKLTGRSARLALTTLSSMCLDVAERLRAIEQQLAPASEAQPHREEVSR